MKAIKEQLSRRKQAVALAVVSVLLVLSAFRLYADVRAFGNVESWSLSGLHLAFSTAANQSGDEPYERTGARLYNDAYTELATLDELARTSLLFRRYAPGDSLLHFVTWASAEQDPAQQEKNLACFAQIADLLEPIFILRSDYNYLSDPDGVAQVLEQVREAARAAYPEGKGA